VSEEGDQALHLYARQLSRDALERENQRLRGIVPEVLERLNDELCAENEALRAKLDKALTVCRCAARVVDSSAYQGVSDEDCDLENAVHNWRLLGPNVG
jgi:hypothetical protein